MNPRRPVVEIIDPMVVEILRQKSPAERLSQAFGMWDFAISVLNSAIRRDHPEWTPSQIQREIRRRIRGSPEP